MMTLKVFGGLMPGRGRAQVRTIVAAKSQAEAARLLGLSLSYARNYWSGTSNDTEIAVAMSAPGTVFQASGSFDKGEDDFKPEAK